jgi:hypothetical protein
LADNVLSQAFFGLYEFFANIVPGTIVLSTLILMFKVTLFSSSSFFSESIQFLLFILSAFIIGLALQALSSRLTKGTKYPSEHYLEAGHPTIPEYMKNDIRMSANQMFGIPMEAKPQEIFDVCYIYLLQNKITTRLQTFLYAYTLARCMIATMLAESLLFAVWFYFNLEPLLLVTALFSIPLALVFKDLFLNYQKAFAKEVLRSFFINSHQKTDSNN